MRRAVAREAVAAELDRRVRVKDGKAGERQGEVKGS